MQILASALNFASTKTADTTGSTDTSIVNKNCDA